MNTCAFLSMDSLDDFECYDELLYAPMNRIGWQVEAISWHCPDVNWNDFDVVIIRSSWDYQDQPDEFIAVLENIEQSSARLENHIDLVKWNLHKSYLRELEAKGIKIVPTIWPNGIDEEKLITFFKELDAEEIVLKPCIGASANNAHRLKYHEIRQCLPELLSTFSQRDYLVQPFMPAIVGEGEYSMIYFGHEHSHSLLKTPKDGDFRVQEEYGGQLELIQPEANMLIQATNTFKALPYKPLYSRIDLVRDGSDFALMEIELIEPSLYFNLDPGSPERFSNVFQQWLKS